MRENRRKAKRDKSFRLLFSSAKWFTLVQLKWLTRKTYLLLLYPLNFSGRAAHRRAAFVPAPGMERSSQWRQGMRGCLTPAPNRAAEPRTGVWCKRGQLECWGTGQSELFAVTTLFRSVLAGNTIWRSPNSVSWLEQWHCQFQGFIENTKCF